jgi:GcrA cell cycle regulator
MTWNEANVEIVRVMWSEGHSASTIARALGQGISRNAVIGVIHRRKLPGPNTGRPRGNGPRSIQRTCSGSPRRGSPVLGDMHVEGLPLEIVELDPIPGVTIANVTDKQCRWPYGDPADREHFHLCGHPTITLSPYCAAHARKAFAPGYVRARRDEAAEELSEIFRRERVFA